MLGVRSQMLMTLLPLVVHYDVFLFQTARFGIGAGLVVRCYFICAHAVCTFGHGVVQADNLLLHILENLDLMQLFRQVRPILEALLALSLVFRIDLTESFRL